MQARGVPAPGPEGVATPMRVRRFRCPDRLWERVDAVALERGQTVSDVIRAAMTAYAEEQPWV